MINTVACPTQNNKQGTCIPPTFMDIQTCKNKIKQTRAPTSVKHVNSNQGRHWPAKLGHADLLFSALFFQLKTSPPSIICLSNTYWYFHHMHFILSGLKCYENVTSSFRNNLWSAKEKRNNEKVSLFFFLFSTFIYFLFFSSLWTPPTFKPHNFLISYSF